MKPGYKQTEVGVIPEDWGVAELIALASIDRGKFSARPRNDPKYYGGQTPFLQTGDISRSGGRISTFSQTLNAEGVRVSRVFPSETLFFTIAANIGDVGIANFAAACPDSIVAISPKSATDKQWLLYELSTRKNAFEALASPGAQLNLNLEKLRPYQVRVPTLPEQRAIATALSDVDALLDGLDRLIVKKRDLKQAAMQQLLTGQTRLPGFQGEWEVVLAGSIGSFRGGNGFPLDVQGEAEGDYPFFKVSDMNNEGNETFMNHSNNWISEKTRKRLSFTLFPAGSIVFAKVGAAIFLERKKILNQPSCIDNNMAAYVLDERRADIRFVHTQLLSIKVGSLVATTALPSLNGKQLSEIRIKLPPLPEQTAIAKVLSDMYTELAALEQRRDKTRDIKQAMMQELLTGRTRLV